MEQVTLITEKDFNQLIGKIDMLEKKIDALSGGVGSKQLYTIIEACQLLQVSKRTLQKYRDEGMLSFTQIGDKIYFERSDIEAFIKGNKVAAYKVKGGPNVKR